MSKLDDFISRFLDKRNGWVLLAVVAAILFLAVATSAHAAESYSARDERGNVVRLFNEPCKSPDLLVKANERLRHLVKNAEFTYNGKKLRACWVAMPDMNVHIIDEQMDVTVIPASVFQKDIES